MLSNDRGLLFIISAASGTGKTTLAECLVQTLPNLRMSRSYTSRAARAGERDGVDYNFTSRPEFEAMVQRQEFLEWADVFGNFYGTRRPDTEKWLASGQDVVLVIDVQATTGGRELGRCDRGRQKIVYLQGPPSSGAAPATAASSPARPAPARGEAPILTECRDGRVMMGGSCRK